MPKQTIKLPVRTMQIADTEPKPQQMSRQSLRRVGYFQILLELKRRFPNVPRHELRAAARICQKDAWTLRDKAAVAKFLQP